MIEEEFNAALNRNRSHPLTLPIKECDKKRKEILHNLYEGIRFFNSSSDTEIAKAAQLLQAIYDETVTHLPDKKRRTLTAGISRFLNECDTSETAPLVKGIFKDKINQLETTQEKMLLMIEKRAEEKEFDTTPTLHDVRKRMYEFYKVLKNVLLLNLHINEEETKELVHNLNGRIGQIMTTARALHTLGENRNRRLSEASDGEFVNEFKVTYGQKMNCPYEEWKNPIEPQYHRREVLPGWA